MKYIIYIFIFLGILYTTAYGYYTLAKVYYPHQVWFSLYQTKSACKIAAIQWRKMNKSDPNWHFYCVHNLNPHKKNALFHATIKQGSIKRVSYFNGNFYQCLASILNFTKNKHSISNVQYNYCWQNNGIEKAKSPKKEHFYTLASLEKAPGNYGC